MFETTVSQARMDALIDGHYRAEEAGDLDAIVQGFIPDAEHDVSGNPEGPRRGGQQIADFYRDLLAELRIDRFETLRRWYGERHAVDESILHATAIGRPFGLDGRGRRVSVRLLHLFEFADGLISRENAWLDMYGLEAQLS
jgi:ketosteroid isomerase-like protein